MQEILILSKCSIFLFHLDLWLSTIYLLKSLQQAKLEHSLLTQLLHERVNKLLSFLILVDKKYIFIVISFWVRFIVV